MWNQYLCTTCFMHRSYVNTCTTVQEERGSSPESKPRLPSLRGRSTSSSYYKQGVTVVWRIADPWDKGIYNSIRDSAEFTVSCRLVWVVITAMVKIYLVTTMGCYNKSQTKQPHTTHATYTILLVAIIVLGSVIYTSGHPHLRYDVKLWHMER